MTLVFWRDCKRVFVPPNILLLPRYKRNIGSSRRKLVSGMRKLAKDSSLSDLLFLIIVSVGMFFLDIA